MTGLRDEVATEIRKLNPRDRDALADVIGLIICAVMVIGLLIFAGYGGWTLLQYLGMI